MTVLDASSAKKSSAIQRITFSSKPIAVISANAVPREADSQAVLFLKFKVEQSLPQSNPNADPAVANSEIRVYFVGIGAVFVKNDLGYGFLVPTDVPCKGFEGLTPYSGSDIVCTVFPGSKPYIRVMNYDPVVAPLDCTVAFPTFTTPAGAFSLTVRILKSQNDVYNELLNGKADVSLVANPAVAATATPVTDPEKCYTVDNRRVSRTFSLTFYLNAGANVLAGQKLKLRMPFYDLGFIRDASTVTCQFNGPPVLAASDCIPFMGVDYILIKVQTLLANAAPNFLTISGLVWPRYTKPNSAVYIDILTSTDDTQKILSYPSMLSPMPNYFQKYIISADKSKRGEANVQYTITFQTKNDIPDGASLIIDLPIEYTLLASSPPVVIEYPDFTASTRGKLSHYYSSAKVTVENIGAFPKLTDFRVLLKGVKNPTSSNVLSTWGGFLMLDNYLVERIEYFASFSLDQTALPNTITLNSIYSFPDNEALKGDHFFSFTPRTSLKEGARITVYFPSQYRLLPSQPQCLISGQLNSFESCTTDLNSISVELNSAYIAGTINLKIKDIMNPDAGETDKFVIQTSYDGQIIDIVDTSIKDGKTIFISSKPIDIYMTQFSYDPQNEGEISTYTFGFNPNLYLEESMEIVIKFPDTYDNRIGDKVQCYGLKNLKGNYKCTILEKTITVSGFDPIRVSDDNPIVLEIRGVVNPNRKVNSDAGTINIGVLYAGTTTFLSFVREAGVIETVESPGWTFFQAVLSGNTFARFTSDYLFNFTVYDPIPNDDSGGMVIVDLPIQFEASDGNLTCTAPQSGFSSPHCSLVNNRIYIRGNPQQYSGHLDLTIQKVLNPLEQQDSSYFYIKTYDGFRKKIIERSFYNLDPFFFSFTFAGPIIRVNDDLPLVIEAGTQTVDLKVSLDRLSSLNIIIKPNSMPGISFIPYQVPINIGEKEATIRVSVAESFAEGDYLIEWKVLKDLIPPYYSPIKPTKLTVTKNRGVLISVEQINDVPFGGTSLPCRFSVVNAPDSSLEIRVNTKFSYKGIALDKNIVYFSSGTNSGTFTVLFTDTKAASEENLATGQVELTLSGENSKVYTMNSITLYFNVVQEDITPPSILELKLASLDQYSVTIDIKTDDVVACYYMVLSTSPDRAQRHRSPSDLRSQKPGAATNPHHAKQVRLCLRRTHPPGLLLLRRTHAQHRVRDLHLHRRQRLELQRRTRHHQLRHRRYAPFTQTALAQSRSSSSFPSPSSTTQRKTSSAEPSRSS